MKSLRVSVLLLAATACAGCFDFVAPDFPEAGAPAVLQAAIFVDDAGRVSIDALLAPGLGIGGVQRQVRRDTLDVMGLRLAPQEVRKNGTRAYHFNAVVPADTTPVELQLVAPRVEDIVGPPPAVDWFGIRKTDPDTITWTRGTDLVLHVRTDAGPSVPPPAIRQWFLALAGSDRVFRVSSDGFPPETLRIPSEWVPAPRNGLIDITLIYYQAGQQRPPSGDYIGNISFNLQLRWILQAR